VAAEGAVTNADGGIERPERKAGRPSKATPFAPKVSAWLATEPSLSTEELLRRAIDSGYCGHKTAFYALVAGVRPPRPTPAARFDGLPGQFSQHDFGQVDVRFLDGRKKRVRFFASRLTYSRFVAVTLVDDERTETIVRCLERHFVAFGGLPLLAVFDRPKATAKSGPKGRDVEAWNSTFAQAIIHIGVGVEMRAPRGSPERLVVWVRSAFFKHRRFRDQADLDAQLDAWLVEVNTKTPSSKTNEIPEIRRLEELVRLRPIKVPR
jgi:transposase